MQIVLNGQPREVALDPERATVEGLIAALEMKPDRVAVEQNGDIVRRPAWPDRAVREGDRFEIVHFVGGGR
jgi:thiamine biosynthesis protein ThiS